jgi:hypothetical protein
MQETRIHRRWQIVTHTVAPALRVQVLSDTNHSCLPSLPPVRGRSALIITHLCQATAATAATLTTRPRQTTR